MKQLFSLLILIGFVACKEESPTLPKPRAYPKVVYPEHSYQIFNAPYCNMSFEYPVYAEIQQDTLFFKEKPENPCWFNLFIPRFNCYLYCTYSEVQNQQKFEKLTNDAFNLAYKHDQRANYIDDNKFTTKNGLGGIQFELTGPAATPFQFFVTDSTQNFLRGSLYFNTQVRPDSLLPVYQFVKQDIVHMIATFKFNKKK